MTTGPTGSASSIASLTPPFSDERLSVCVCVCVCVGVGVCVFRRYTGIETVRFFFFSGYQSRGGRVNSFFYFSMHWYTQEKERGPCPSRGGDGANRRGGREDG